jgi:hypothetical protein
MRSQGGATSAAGGVERGEEGKRLARDAGREWPRQQTTARDSTTGRRQPVRGVFDFILCPALRIRFHSPASKFTHCRRWALQFLFAPAARCRHRVVNSTCHPPPVAHHARRSLPAAWPAACCPTLTPAACCPTPAAARCPLPAAHIPPYTTGPRTRQPLDAAHSPRISSCTPLTSCAPSPPPSSLCAVFPPTPHLASHWHAMPHSISRCPPPVPLVLFGPVLCPIVNHVNYAGANMIYT